MSKLHIVQENTCHRIIIGIHMRGLSIGKAALFIDTQIAYLKIIYVGSLDIQFEIQYKIYKFFYIKIGWTLFFYFNGIEKKEQAIFHLKTQKYFFF